MSSRQTRPAGALLHETPSESRSLPRDEALATFERMAAAEPLRWLAADLGDVLLVQRPSASAGAAPTADLKWEALAALGAEARDRPRLVVAASPDGRECRMVIVAETVENAVHICAELARSGEVEAFDEIDKISDYLSKTIRYIKNMINEKSVVAAVFAVRGRGRALGPIRPEALIRFGVSNWG